MITSSPDTVIITLNATDRCDACRAQAYVQVFLQSGSLLFCGHHYNKHKDAVAPLALEVVDETFRIGDAKLDVSA